MAAQGRGGLYVTNLEPTPRLLWDNIPRSFRVGICNSLPVSTVPEGQFVVVVYLPEVNVPAGQTSRSPAQLTPGLHEMTFSSWTPGLENHRTICVQRQTIAVEVQYNDFRNPNAFRPVEWPDGKSRVSFPIPCQADFS